MEKLSPQKEIILSYLRGDEWVCGRVWLDRIKDDRIRLTELNRTYMKEKGWEIIGEACRGSACGNRGCPLFKRKAVRLQGHSSVVEQTPYKGLVAGSIPTAPIKAPQSQNSARSEARTPEVKNISPDVLRAQRMVKLFNLGRPAEEIFSPNNYQEMYMGLNPRDL